MKTLSPRLFFLLMVLGATSLHAQVNNPPQDLYVDPVSLQASWSAPDTNGGSDWTTELLDYYVFMDDSLVGATIETTYNFDSLGLVYGTEHTAGVAAHYTTGFSDTVMYPFTSYFLPPITDLTAICDSVLLLCWTVPEPSFFILGFNIYRNGDLVDFLWISPGPGVIQYYVDVGLPPGTYCFTVSTVYDLAYFGFPGEEGESMEAGPVCCTFSPGFHLPFFEDWSSGSFDENYWATDGQNWEINGQQGQDPPCASFAWDPVITNYTLGLESYPMLADSLDGGYIFLEFDIKLDDVNPTGEEKMLIQVWNLTNQTWITLDTFINVYGSFGWRHKKLDITPHALQQIFKVRFLAIGENSIDILGWYIDNIHVYHDCYTPSNLHITSGTGLESYLILQWDPPFDTSFDQWIHWDDGVNFTAIGTVGPIEFDAAARWEPDQLADFDGASLTQVAIFPKDANTSYRVRVWTGTGPANMVIDQPVSDPEINVWNFIELDNPYPIDITQELWVGYNANTEFGYPAGCDDGPAIDGYGNMINYFGWKTLLEMNPELDYNWNIQAYLSFDSVNFMLQYRTEERKTIENPSNRFENSNIYYQLYRSIDQSPYELYTTTTDTFYVDYDIFLGRLYCYKVQSVYEGILDSCESGFSNIECEMLDAVDPLSLNNQIQVFPNPVKDHIMINSFREMDRVAVYSMMGQNIIVRETQAREYSLDVSGLPSGVYYLKVFYSGGAYGEKVVVLH